MLLTHRVVFARLGLPLDATGFTQPFHWLLLYRQFLGSANHKLLNVSSINATGMRWLKSTSFFDLFTIYFSQISTLTTINLIQPEAIFCRCRRRTRAGRTSHLSITKPMLVFLAAKTMFYFVVFCSFWCSWWHRASQMGLPFLKRLARSV